MGKAFTIKEAFSFSLKMFRQHFWFLIGIAFAVYVNRLAERFVFYSEMLERGSFFLGDIFPVNIYRFRLSDINSIDTLIRLVFSFIKIMLLFGLGRIGLDLYDTGKSNWKRLFVYPSSIRILCAYFIYLCFALVPMFPILIIPGIISVPFGILVEFWLIKYSFFYLLIIDKNCQIVESLKRSARLIIGHRWQVFALSLLYVAISSLIILSVVVPSIIFAVLIAALMDVSKNAVMDFSRLSLFVIFDGFGALSRVLFSLAFVYIYRKLQEARSTAPGETLEKSEHTAPGM